MDYLTNHYKNLCEKLQEKIDNLQKEINEANIRNPTQQFHAQFRDYKNPSSVSRHATLPGGYASESGGAGWKRMNQMMQFQAAKAIAEPHEQEAIERVLTDMKDTAPGAPGTAADAGHMRTSLGAIKRLSSTKAYQDSLKTLEGGIDKIAIKNSVSGVGVDDYYDNLLSRSESERFEDEKFDQAQRTVLGYAGKEKPKQ